jgi:hypothetical protein
MMTGVEIWGLEDGWKEIGKVHGLFCKRVIGMPNTAANGACAKELERTNRKEKVVERVLRHWQRLWEMDETGRCIKITKFREREQLTTGYGAYLDKWRRE